MNVFPELNTERFWLRRLTLNDSAALFDYFSNDDVTRYYDLETLTSIEQARQIIMNWQLRWEQDETIRWGICVNGHNTVIGTIGFHNWSALHQRTEVGYELAPQYWRQGIMSECLQEVLRFGFVEMGFNRIEALIDPDNVSSRKLLEKCGLKQEGLLRDYLFEKGKFVDAAIFSILKKEYITS